MIPEELRSLPQWVSCAADKIPLNPKTGAPASVTDSRTWGTYEEAVHRGPLVGFVLTESDPYAFIDLDKPYCQECDSDSCEHAQDIRARQIRIYEAFDTYAELSQSGNGVHLICRGSVPQGRKRDKVEVYSSKRFMICTGQSVRGVEIKPCQELLDILYAQINGNSGTAELEELDEVMSDAALVEMASNAVNGEKFDRLCSGEWEQEYPSQSEADFALLSIFAFYTRSNEQVRRLFRMSKLGKRDKAQRNAYLNTALEKIRAHEPERIDFTALLNGANGSRQSAVEGRDEGELAGHASPSTNGKPVRVADNGGSSLSFPPGFIGELAQYIYHSSSRPVAEVAIAAALGLAAGVCGRQFNISGTGLNLYIILLAKTGIGKEEGPRGIDRLMSVVRQTVPPVDTFLGPAAFASSQGVIRTLDEQPCFVSILGEFGLTLQTLSDDHANERTINYRRVLLDLYSKSGRSGTLRPTAYSDRTNNTKTLFSPALTILGESTQEAFYAGLTLQHVAEGLIPRFLIIEHQGDRPNRNEHPYGTPDARLVQRLADVCGMVLTMAANQSWQNVVVKDGGLLDAFDKECDKKIRSGANEGIRQLWNRAHLKALRVAALLTVMERPHDAAVGEVEARWAIELVRRDVKAIVERFESGDVGEGETKQASDLDRILDDYFTCSNEQLESYDRNQEGFVQMRAKKVIARSYLSRRTASLAAYRKHRNGARTALNEAILDLVNAGVLVEVPKTQMQEMFDTKAVAYVKRS